METIYMERKGVSTYISVLLLIVVVIAGGIMIYGYTMGWFGRLGGEGEMGTLSVDSAVASNGNITAYIRNVGSSSVTLDVAYVDNEQIPEANFTGTDLTIPEGEVQNVTITDAGISPGTTYEVKIVATDNTQIVFSVKAE
jgi:uncharacterized protein (UPF0333 family)